MSVKFLIILDNINKLNFFKEVFGDTYDYVCTDGLLYDLPANTLGIDILNNFSLTEIQRSKAASAVKQIKQHRSAPFYVVTSPNEEGVRLYAQILKILHQSPDTKAHVQLSYLSRETVQIFSKLAQPLNLNILEGAQTRRCCERLGGHFLSEFLTLFTKKFSYPIKPHISLGAAYILSYIYHHVKKVHNSNDGYRLILENGTPFKANEVLASNGNLSTFLPKFYNSDREATEVFELIQEFSNDLHLEHKEKVPDTWNPPSSINFENVLSFLLSKYQLDNLLLYRILYHLYNTGYITYFQKSSVQTPTLLLENVRNHFKDNNWMQFLNVKKLGLLSKNVSHCFLPVHFKPYSHSDSPAIKSIHKCILDYFCAFFTKPQEVEKELFLFKLKKHFFLGESLNLPSNLPSYIYTVYEPVPIPTSKDKFSIQLYSLECLEEGVKIADLFNFFDHSPISLHLYTALEQLLHSYNYLEFNNGQLYLTEKGFICSELLNHYSAFFSLENLKLDERILNSIRKGSIHKDIYLHSWYHSFKSHHDKIIQGLKY